jgi:hypothetical protein
VLAHKKVTKEKGAPCRVPAEFPALLSKPGDNQTRPGKPHKKWLAAELKQCSPKTPDLAVLLGAVAGEWGRMLLFRRKPEPRKKWLRRAQRLN